MCVDLLLLYFVIEYSVRSRHRKLVIWTRCQTVTPSKSFGATMIFYCLVVCYKMSTRLLGPAITFIN